MSGAAAHDLYHAGQIQLLKKPPRTRRTHEQAIAAFAAFGSL
jgi:hypothetical protein